MKLSVWKIDEDNSMQMSLSAAPAPQGGSLLFEFEAATWEEAQALYHMRMGWSAYDPGEPAKCPVHDDDNIVYYPEGSGQCWKCELEKTARAKPSTDFAAGVEAAAKHVEAHSCVSSCCNAQPSSGEASALAACIRRLTD